MEAKTSIKYISIIIIILVVVFLSQQAFFKGTEKTFISNAGDQIKTYLSKGSDWVASNVYPKISGEVQKRGDAIKEEINQEKQKVSESIGEKIKNYFSGISDSVFNPGKLKQNQNQNCPPVDTQAQPQTPAQ